MIAKLMTVRIIANGKITLHDYFIEYRFKIIVKEPKM